MSLVVILCYVRGGGSGEAQDRATKSNAGARVMSRLGTRVL